MLAGGEWTPASGHCTFIPTSKSTGFSGLPGCNVQTCKLLRVFVDYWLYDLLLFYCVSKSDINLPICLQIETPVTQIETNIHTEPEHVH